MSTSKFKNQVWLITGAAGGLGETIALQMAKAGAKLVLTDLHNHTLNQLQDKIGPYFSGRTQDLLLRAVDVSDAAAMSQLTTDALAQLGTLDGVIANAGVGGLNPAYSFSTAINEQVFKINYFGTINTFLPALQYFKQQRKGHLVGICSLASYRGLAESASYCASKSAQAALLESWRLDLKLFGVQVTTVFPGFIKTAMADHKEFPMPFTVNSEQAAKIILRGICKGQSKIRFPWPMTWLAGINRFIPTTWYDRMIQVALRPGKVLRQPMLFGNKNK